jgi:hypothetical protein
MTDTVTAKFRCDYIHIFDKDYNQTVSTQYDKRPTPEDAPYIRVAFEAVTAECEENKSWSKWTPSGQLQMSITNPDCYNKFDPGAEYYLTIRKA